MEKIASIDRGWLRTINVSSAFDRNDHVEKIASIDRGWLLNGMLGRVLRPVVWRK